MSLKSSQLSELLNTKIREVKKVEASLMELYSQLLASKLSGSLQTDLNVNSQDQNPEQTMLQLQEIDLNNEKQLKNLLQYHQQLHVSLMTQIEEMQAKFKLQLEHHLTLSQQPNIQPADQDPIANSFLQ